MFLQLVVEFAFLTLRLDRTTGNPLGTLELFCDKTVDERVYLCWRLYNDVPEYIFRCPLGEVEQGAKFFNLGNDFFWTKFFGNRRINRGSTVTLSRLNLR